MPLTCCQNRGSCVLSAASWGECLGPVAMHETRPRTHGSRTFFLNRELMLQLKGNSRISGLALTPSKPSQGFSPALKCPNEGFGKERGLSRLWVAAHRRGIVGPWGFLAQALASSLLSSVSHSRHALFRRSPCTWAVALAHFSACLVLLAQACSCHP